MDIDISAVKCLIEIKSHFIPVEFSRNSEAKHETLNWIVNVTSPGNGGKSFNIEYSAGIGHLPKGKKPHEVKPKTCDVASSLLVDFTEENFEDWASNFGYEDDAHARATYRACRETTKKMLKIFGRERINKLRELLQDY